MPHSREMRAGRPLWKILPTTLAMTSSWAQEVLECLGALEWPPSEASCCWGSGGGAGGPPHSFFGWLSLLLLSSPSKVEQSLFCHTSSTPLDGHEYVVTNLTNLKPCLPGFVIKWLPNTRSTKSREVGEKRKRTHSKWEQTFKWWRRKSRVLPTPCCKMDSLFASLHVQSQQVWGRHFLHPNLISISPSPDSFQESADHHNLFAYLLWQLALLSSISLPHCVPHFRHLPRRWGKYIFSHCLTLRIRPRNQKPRTEEVRKKDSSKSRREFFKIALITRGLRSVRSRHFVATTVSFRSLESQDSY